MPRPSGLEENNNSCFSFTEFIAKGFPVNFQALAFAKSMSFSRLAFKEVSSFTSIVAPVNSISHNAGINPISKSHTSFNPFCNFGEKVLYKFQVTSASIPAYLATTEKA